jgi:nitrite reductase (cytochrome c-552)
MTESKPSFFSHPLVRMGLVALVAAGATALVLALYANISKRKEEARQTSLRLVDLD